MVFKLSNRIIIGFFLALAVILSFYYNLDYFLLSFILIFITYDLINIKVINKNYLFFIFATSIFCLFFNFNYLYKFLYLFEILFIFLILFNNKYKKIFFIISVYIFWFILLYISDVDRSLLYIIIFISFFNDTIAYISGKLIKGPLILPSISPKKTWSGTSISFISSTIVLTIINFNIFMSMLLAISLFFGDIFFSYFKRLINLKDFSSSMGNHGGILDRLDSMFFITILLQIYLVLK